MTIKFDDVPDDFPCGGLMARGALAEREDMLDRGDEAAKADKTKVFVEQGDDTGAITTIPASPAGVFFARTLPFEIVMRTGTLEEIREAYKYSEEEFGYLMSDPVFIAAIQSAAEQVKDEGVTFKLKAQMQADALLDKSWQMIHDPKTPPSVAASLLKETIGWAGYAAKDEKPAATGPVGPSFSITIDMRADSPKTLTIEGEKV